MRNLDILTEQKELVQGIIDELRNEVKPLKLNELAKRLSIRSDTTEYVLLKTVLKELCDQKVIEKSSRRKYSIKGEEDFNTIEGAIKIKGGAGLVKFTRNGKARKARIKRKHLNTAFDGDRVLVRLLKSKKDGKPRGAVIKILKRRPVRIVGKIEYDNNFYFFVPDDDKYYVDFLINPERLHGAQDGDKVKVRLVRWDNPQKSPLGEVEDIVVSSEGAGELKQELDSILDEFSLPLDFSGEVKEETAGISKPDIKRLLRNRLDLRKEEIITIDPIDAKDFDDAVSLKFLKNGNSELGVHIADVSHFVKEESQIDKEGYRRGSSVYLADRVVPMLPEKLSNELCSLKPNRLRLAYSVIMQINPKGDVVNHKIAETIIKSKKRFNYKQAQNIIESGKGDYSKLIIPMHKLAQKLRARRFKSGGVDFESSEVKFRFDKNNNPVEAELKRSLEANQMIEEFMLIANKTVAEHIKKISRKRKDKSKYPFLYRIHDDPDKDKLKEILRFFRALGVKFTVNNYSSKEINRIVKLFEGKPEKPVAHQIILRAMAKAEYSNENIGHYGLGFKEYAHFTSPIRRYPDLVIHRLLKEYADGRTSAKRINYLDSILGKIAEHCTETEREAMEAERASVRAVQTYMARKYLGKTLQGTISGITSFGVFVILDKFYGEGLVHIRDLIDDYYIYDEKNYRLIGRRKKKILRFGDRIKVRVVHVDLEHRKIDLDFVDQMS